MKKKLLFIIVVVLLCVMSAFVFAACNKSDNNANTKDDSTGKKKSLELLHDFFAETLKSKDIVVTCKDKDGEVQYTETVKGDASYLLGKDKSKTYAYKKGDVYYWASITQEVGEDEETVENRSYYCSDSANEHYLEGMEEIYATNYCSFMAYINMVDLFPTEDATFKCSVDSNETAGFRTDTLTFEYATKGGTYTITVISEVGLVQNFRVAVEDAADPQASKVFTWTIAYGSASIELPDTDAWDREEAARRKRIQDNEKAIEDRDDFFESAKFAENVSITALDMLTFTTLLSETIADEIDRVDYGTYKTYAYMEELSDGEADYYVVYDGDEKTYTVNGDDYDEYCLVWYDRFIALYDEELLESADFTYEYKSGIMTYNVKVDNDVVYSISVTGSSDSITQIGISGIDDSGVRFAKGIMLSYGGSQLQKPDLSGFNQAE